MRTLRLFILLQIALGCNSFLLGQENFTDSIADLSSRVLDRLTIIHHNKRDTIRGVTEAKLLVEKSKRESDFKYQSRGYHTLYLFEADLVKRKKYADSMYYSAKASKNKNALCNAYFSLASSNYFLGDYQKSMEQLSEAYKLALKLKNKNKIVQIETDMASIKNLVSRYYEANLIYTNELKKYDNKVFSQLKNKRKFLSLLLNTSKSYARLKQYDSSLIYSKKGLFYLENYKDEYYKENFERVMGTGLIGVGQYDLAIELLKDKKKHISKRNQTEIFVDLGLAYKKKGDTLKAVAFYIKCDSLLESSGAAIYESNKGAYKFLVEYFQGKNDILSSSKYLKKYFKTDSLLSQRYNSVGERIHRLYDLPKLKDDQERANTRNRIFYGIISTLALALLCTLFLIGKQRKENRKQKAIVNSYLADGTELIAEPVRIDSTKQRKAYLVEETRRRLIADLRTFQNNKGYLDSNITQHALAKSLNTNHTNLYKILKHDFNITFPNYLKKLRIENAINSLMNQPELLKYTIDGLAQEFGFTNPDTFSRSFKEVTRVKPSIFIAELKKQRKLSDNS